ncbi:MAG: hypothetical protein Q7S36_03795, partial [Candidatus Liptonbacteria bacterium]|nr:hypothetical protein [Candidatus Liptonbacteria bacterium]
ERTLMVPFGPFSLAWTTERTERGDPVNWRVGTVVPAHVAIAPVSQADYMNPPKPPKGPVVDDKTLTASLRLGGGIVFAVLGLVCAGYTIVSLKKHKLESPFVAALKVLESDAHSRALRAEFAGEEDCGGADRLALDVFRSCLRKKFKLPAVVTPIDVFHALDSRNLYSPFARRAVELWTSGDKLFYREQKETTGALEKVFALLRELNRRELDELGSPRRQG